MEKSKQDLLGDAPVGHIFVPAAMGSAAFVALDGEGSTYKYETGSTELKHGFKGPPWGVEPGMHFVCDEVGIDADQFIDGLAQNKSDTEMAREFGVPEGTIRHLRERFYKVESITGNYGQD
ncbi:hypothetical protein [Thermanaerosceptrum fracticalcis]|nr:hypothetical protein [Thermanaerosceptrum fracticalcis]